MQSQCVRTGRTETRKPSRSIEGDPELEASILHWWKNVQLHDAGAGYHIDSEDCALCLVRMEGSELQCDKPDYPCPVYQTTGCLGCHGSPWVWVSFKQVHPVVMAWWLEDLKAGCAEHVNLLCPFELRTAFPYKNE